MTTTRPLSMFAPLLRVKSVLSALARCCLYSEREQSLRQSQREVVLSGAQLIQALVLINDSKSAASQDDEVVFFHGDGHSGIGWYAYSGNKHDEGVIYLDGDIFTPTDCARTRALSTPQTSPIVRRDIYIENVRDHRHTGTVLSEDVQARLAKVNAARRALNNIGLRIVSQTVVPPDRGTPMIDLGPISVQVSNQLLGMADGSTYIFSTTATRAHISGVRVHWMIEQ